MTAPKEIPRIASWLALKKGDFDATSIRRKLELTGHVSDLIPGDAGVMIKLYEETSTHLFIPRQAGFLSPSLIRSAIDCTVLGDERDFGPAFPLRSYQPPKVEEFLKGLDDYPYGGLLCAAAGSGKTVMGLEIVRRLGRTTLVLVHKEFLVHQWRERIGQFLPRARIGIVQQDRCDYGKDYDIVIGLIQSLSQRQYHPAFYDWPGVVVSDETHRLGAETWSGVIAKFPARIRIGLTATPRRKDEMEPVFFWHIGPILAQIRREDTPVMPPYVREVKFQERYSLGRYMMRGGKFNISKWLTDIAKHPRRNAMIVKLLLQALANGRKIIVLTHRLDHLAILEEAVLRESPGTVIDRYVGGRSEAELMKAAQAQLVLATYAMAEEGLDIPELDCAFLVTPKGDVEQAVGRVQRYVEGKKQPIVIDVVDTAVGIADGLSIKRRRTYAKLKAIVT